MPRPFHAQELRAAEPIWLLELSFAGRVFHFASEVVEITANDGTIRPFAGTLGSVSVEEAFDFLSESADFPSVSLEVVFPLDVAELIEQGHDLAAATGELALHLEGQTYDDRRVFLEGNVAQPEYGASGEPVRFSLERLILEDSALFPEAGLIASNKTVAAAPESSIGRAYPFVFGEVGATIDEAGITVKAYATPGFQVGSFFEGPTNRRKILIAGHRVAATTCNIYNSDADQNMVGNVVYHEPDALGQVYAYTAFAFSVESSDKDSYSIDWTGSEGATPNLQQNGPLERGGDLLRYMMTRSSLPVDLGRTVAAAEQLQAFKFGGYIDKPIAPLKWLNEHIVPLLPVSIAAGAGGIYPIVWRYDATAEDAVEAITAGPQFERQGAVSYESEDVFNEIRLRYGFAQWREDFTRSITISGEPAKDDPEQISSTYTRASFSRYGTQAKEIESVMVYDPATAAAIVKWQARAFAFRRRSISYAADYRFGWLERGDIVTITDTDLHLAGRVCLVQSITWGASALSIKLLLIDDPPRD
jgi:hypothetical protein